ncbi:MAG: tyrosine-protein phosphatase [Anaerolineaceae bacterium]
MTTPTFQPEGIHNFRSIAPYPAKGGAHFRAHAVYRSGALERMTAADAAWLRDSLGVQTVIDLRHPDELTGVSQDHGLADRVVPISIFSETTAQLDVTAELNGLYGPGISGGRYLHYLGMAGERFARAFRLFAEAPSYPVLVHCTAGKDRTGVLLALVMDVVGVSEADIAAEYGLSDNSIEALIEYLRATGRVLEGTDAEIRARLATPPEKMAEFMRLLRTKYGTAADYLATQGVTEAEFASVRGHLLDA